MKNMFTTERTTVIDFILLAIETGKRYKTSLPASYLNNVKHPLLYTQTAYFPGMFINPSPGIVQYVYKSTVYKDANNNIVNMGD